MENKQIHIAELKKKRKIENIKARRLLAQFLGLDIKECRLPLYKCSKVLKRFVSDYNELVIDSKRKKADRQGSLF